MRKAYNGMRADEAVENILNMFARTKNNKEYIAMVKKNRISLSEKVNSARKLKFHTED